MFLNGYFKKRRLKKEIIYKEAIKQQEIEKIEHLKNEIEQSIDKINQTMKKESIVKLKDIVRTVVSNKNKINKKIKQVIVYKEEIEKMEEIYKSEKNAEEKMLQLEDMISKMKDIIWTLRQARSIANETIYTIEKEKKKA